jgi:hypothetical protein
MTNTTITAPTITASGNLFYGTTNVATKVEQLESALNGKQATITNASLTVARTNGLKDALDATAKLASANVFTTSQEITGNLKANIVQVAIKTPTISSHLTSKLYVDTQRAESSQTLQTQSTIQSQDIVSLEQLTSTNTSVIFALQVGKQNTLEAGTGIDITNNVITSFPSFVGFRSVTIRIFMTLKICLTEPHLHTLFLLDKVVIGFSI